MLKVLGVGYDHDAAADAQRRILAFFATHLRDTHLRDIASARTEHSTS